MASLPSLFTTAERDLIRSEFTVRFGQEPRLADGMSLRTWHSGAQSGQPKIPKAVASLMERDLVEIGRGAYGPCARFTPAGLDALRRMAQDRRALDPKQFGHVRRELGVEMDDAADGAAA